MTQKKIIRVLIITILIVFIFQTFKSFINDDGSPYYKEHSLEKR